jgi:hypothetical protein
MKTKVAYQKKLAAAQATASADTDLFQAYQEGALTVPYVDAAIERTPFMDKAIAAKWKAVAASKAALTGSSDGRYYSSIMSDFMGMLSSGAKKLTAKELREENFSDKEFLKVLQLKGELLDKNKRGEIIGDEFTGMMKFFQYSLDENKNFMKKFSYFATAFERTQLWGRKVSAQMTGNIKLKRLDRSYADVVDLQQTGPVKDKALNSVFAIYDKKIAENYYDIKTSPDGKEWVQHDGGSFEVKGYSNGSPMVNWKSINKE